MGGKKCKRPGVVKMWMVTSNITDASGAYLSKWAQSQVFIRCRLNEEIPHLDSKVYVNPARKVSCATGREHLSKGACTRQWRPKMVGWHPDRPPHARTCTRRSSTRRASIGVPLCRHAGYFEGSTPRL